MPKLTPAGRFNRRITLLQPVDTPNQSGGYIRTWSTFRVVWAKMNPGKGSEHYKTGKEEETIFHRIVIRYQHGITPMMRVSYKDRIFEIVGVTDSEEAHKEIEITAQELRGKGIS